MTPEIDPALNAYQVFTGPDGQLVLEDLKQTLFHYSTTFVPGDSHATAVNEGMRRALLYIVACMEALEAARSARTNLKK